MKVRIEKIGAIDSAEIDIGKDLIILTGSNNSGKTYLTNVLYGLYKIPIDNVTNFNFIEINEFSIVDNPEVQRKSVVFTISSFDIFSTFETAILRALGKISAKNLSGIFGTSENSFEKSEIHFLKTKEDDFKDLIFRQTFKGINSNLSNKFGLIDFIKTEDSFDVSFRITDFNYEFEEGLKETHLVQVQNVLLQSYLYAIMNGGDRKYISIYPAERIAVDIFQKEIRQGGSGNSILYDDTLHLVTHMSKGFNASNFVNPISKNENVGVSIAIKDFVNNTSIMRSRKDIIGVYSRFADELETILLGGKIEMNLDGSINFINSEGITVDLNLTSSLVKSLSGLVFYFRHVAQKNDVIIIDEPELNLHPKLQIQITKFIAKLVNNGFKVIISTHSDYVIREINTLIMLGKRGKESIDLIKKYEYSYDSILKFNRLGVYFLHDHITDDIEVTESGFDVTAIDDVISEQNSKSEDVYFSLF
jgi:predicted ATP-dependent endonuclease of OLD family